MTADRVSSPDPQTLVTAIAATVRSLAALAAYCEHTEHNETSDRASAEEAAGSLRSIAITLCRGDRGLLLHLYHERLRSVEEHSVLYRWDGGGLPDLPFRTWRDLQVRQAVHDARYHPDVWGLSRHEQLKHYVLHVAKLAGALQDTIDGRHSWHQFEERRLPDLLLFGIKVATVLGQRLPEDTVAP